MVVFLPKPLSSVLAMAPSTSLNFCRNQLIDNCEFISNKDDYISVVTERTPRGEYKAFVLRSNDDFREALISSEPADTLHKAFDSLLMKSCEAVYHYRDTNGFSIPPDIQKANLDAEDNSASAISGGSESSTTAAFSEDDSSEEDELITPATSSLSVKQMHAAVVAAADAAETAEAITARHGDNDLSRFPLSYRDFPKKSRKSTLSAMAATAFAEIRQLPPPTPRDHRSLKRDLDYDDESDEEHAHHQQHHHQHQQFTHLPLRYASQGQGQGQGRVVGNSSRAPPPPPGWSGPPAPPSSIRQGPLMMVPPQLHQQQPPPPNSGPTPAAVRVPIPPPPPAVVVTHPQQKQQQQQQPPHLATSSNSTQRMPMTATTGTTGPLGPPPPPGASGSHMQHHLHHHHRYQQQQQQQQHPGGPAPPPLAPISSGPIMSCTSLSSPPYYHPYHHNSGHRNETSSSVGVVATAPRTSSNSNSLYDVRLTIRWFSPDVEPQRVLERVRPSIKALQEAALLYVQGHMSTFCSSSSTGNSTITTTTTTPPEKQQQHHRQQQQNLSTIGGGGGAAPLGMYKNISNGSSSSSRTRTTPLWGDLRAVVRQALFGPDPDSAYDMTAYRGDDLTRLFAAMSNNSGCSIPSFDIDLVDSAGAGAGGVMRPATQ